MKHTDKVIHKALRNATITYAAAILLPGGLAAYAVHFVLRGRVPEIPLLLLALLVNGLWLLLIFFLLHRRMIAGVLTGLARAVFGEGGGSLPERLERVDSIDGFIHAVSEHYRREMGQVKRYTEMLETINQELAANNEIIEKSPVVFFEWPIPPHSPATFVSKNISRWGYSAEQFLSGEVDFYDMIHPEDLDRVHRTVHKAREAHLDEYTYMYRILTPDGAVRWMEDWTVLVRDDSGALVAEKGLLRDVTDEVLMNDLLTESESRFRELFENASALIYTCDLKGRFTSANRATLNLLNYEWSDLQHRSLYDLLDPANEKVDLDSMEFMEHYLTEPVELKVLDRHGALHVLETRNSLLFREDVPHEVQTVAQDVTDRKLAEARIEYLTYHDRLTGLYNRLYFDMEITALEEQRVQPTVVLIGDMNGLKLANDAFGHKSGDEMLIRVARILEDSASDLDGIVARLSGDEFAILLPGVGKVAAEMVCERIRNGCTEVHDTPIKPNIALGYASWDAEVMTLEEALREAEDSMYHNKLNESKSIRSAIIASLQASLEEKTTETREHAERLKALAVTLGKRLGLQGHSLDELALAAVMHDIGKIGIPDSVLMKAGPLTDEEWQIMKKHPEIGYHIILSSPNMSKVAEFVLAHHERWDGTGYPQGLSQDRIPLISRIIAVVDAYDVMTSERPYKQPLAACEALDEIRRCAGTQFDPEIVRVFIDLYDTLGICPKTS